MSVNVADVSVASIVAGGQRRRRSAPHRARSAFPSHRARASSAAARRRPTTAAASPARATQQKTRWSKSSPPSAESPLVASTSNTPRDSFRIEMSNVPPPRSNTAYVPSLALSRPYAMAAAVGSFSRRSTVRPASRAASLVAWRCASSKYAGTVTTAPSMSPPSDASARLRSACRISAEISTGVLHAGARGDPHDALPFDEPVRIAAIVAEIGEPASHQPLDGNDGVPRVLRRARLSPRSRRRSPARRSGRRRHQRPALVVGQHDGEAVAHGRDERIGRAEVDADCALARVRQRRLARFGDLEQRHPSSSTACSASRSSASFARKRSSRTTRTRRRADRRRRARARHRRAIARRRRQRPSTVRRVRALVVRIRRFVGGFAPLELPRQERDRQLGIGLVRRVDATNVQQVFARARPDRCSVRYASFTRADACNARRFCASPAAACRSGCTLPCNAR